jgi:type IV secretory pathway VirB10-like protein
MTRFLASKVLISGISKQNVLYLGVILTIIIAGVITFWPDNATATETKVPDINTINTYSKDEDIDGILKIIDNKKGITNKNNDINNNLSAEQNQQSANINNMQLQQTVNKAYASKSLMYVANVTKNDVQLSHDINQQITQQQNISKYLLKAGSVIPALMISGINSDIPGDVIAIVRDNVYDSINREYILIPQGAKLVGKYDANILYAQDRIAVFWTQLIYPNGITIDLQGLHGSDISGYSGFHDEVDNHYLRTFGASFVMGVITGAMQYSQANSTNNTGGGLTAGQVMSNSLGQQMGQTSLMITNKNINVKPTIIIKANYPFNIMLVSDLSLERYVLN